MVNLVSTAKKLLVATSNVGKLDDFATLLGDLPINWVTLRDVTLSHMDVPETGNTFVENALQKAHAYATAAGLPTLADDSGLCVDALDGAPGLYSARFASTATERISKLLRSMVDIPMEQRTAHFVAVVALVVPGGVTVYAEGRVDGWISFEPRGAHGFGYDPIFVLPSGQTMAEIPPSAKNSLSHRARALSKLVPILPALFS